MNNNKYEPFSNNYQQQNTQQQDNNQNNNQPYGQNGFYGNQNYNPNYRPDGNQANQNSYNPYYQQGQQNNYYSQNPNQQRSNNTNNQYNYGQNPQYNPNPYGYNQYNVPFQSPEDLQNRAENEIKLKQQKKEIRSFGNAIGFTILAYIIIQNIASLVLSSLGLFDLYSSNSIFADTFNLLCVSVVAVGVPFGIMALVNKKKYTVPIIPQNHIKGKDLCLWVPFGMGCCIVANYAVSMLIQIFKTFGLELTQSNTPDPNSVFACVITLISTAIVPAICEEFAMRCCSLQLVRKYGKAFGVVAVSIVFGLLHGNVIQFAFAFIVGLILGYVTIKTDSIIPAILIHGLNNGVSVVKNIFNYTSGQEISNRIVVGVFVLWIILGVGATIYLGIKKYFAKTVEPYDVSDEPKLSMGQKLASFFLVPGMIFPFIYLITVTASTIHKV